MTNPKSERTKPEDTDFYQQRLRAWQPLLTPWYIILTFLIVGLIFIPIGLVVLFTSNDVVELEQQYSCGGPSCTVDLLVEKDMKAPVYFYYKLTNFYQNHRRYVKSRSDTQLAGTDGSTTLCDPLENYEGKLLYPCGLVANSFFNDNFKVTVSFANDDGTLEPPHPLTETEFDESDIAWETDRDNKYKDIYKNKPLPDTMTREGPSGTLPYLDNQHFMVWMRTAGLPTFRKLYAKINVDLKAGTKVSVDIDDKFDVASFDGTKAVVISTASWLGGKNLFLGYAYVVVGGICLLFALVFTIKQKTCPRDLGSIAFLKLSSKKA